MVKSIISMKETYIAKEEWSSGKQNKTISGLARLSGEQVN